MQQLAEVDENIFACEISDLAAENHRPLELFHLTMRRILLCHCKTLEHWTLETWPTTTRNRTQISISPYVRAGQW